VIAGNHCSLTKHDDADAKLFPLNLQVPDGEKPPKLTKKRRRRQRGIRPVPARWWKRKGKEEIKSPIATTLTPPQGTCQRQLNAKRVEGE